MKMMNKEENIVKLETAINRLETNESTIYFLTYDSKNNPRASVKYIYDLAKTLIKNNFKAKLLVEDKTYSGVSSWLGDDYNEIEIVSIKEDKIELSIDDTLVVPEYYSNALQQLMSFKCHKVMLIQQKDYIFENLPIGSRWIDFGFDKVITTTMATKKYIQEYFPESLVYIIPPIINDIFKPSEKSKKPFIAISCRDRVINRKIISEFYLKYPQFRWITFKDMVQQTYVEFAEALKECMVSVWVDDESTFGTFPLESMKCGVPLIGKVPNVEPDWIGENGFWTYDGNKIVELLGTYVLAWIEGVELSDDVMEKIKETYLPYEQSITENNILAIFNSLKNKRIETIKNVLDKLKQQETI
jgi:hypothetical protein